MDISSIRKTWQALYDGLRTPSSDELLIQDLIRENQELAQRNTDLRMINEGLKKALALSYSLKIGDQSVANRQSDPDVRSIDLDEIPGV